VADAGGFDLDQYLARPGTFEIDSLQAEGLACLASNSSAGLHVTLSLMSPPDRRLDLPG
jgi:hypothetical protein